MTQKIKKSDAEWQAELSQEAYQITRKQGTERAFTGKYWNAKDKGAYHCTCCGAELFSSDTKYNSGSGWPSFREPVNEENVSARQDNSHGMRRTEVVCSHCDAHLGHIFPDGPQPTGLRYCINSASLKLVKAEKGN